MDGWMGGWMDGWLAYRQRDVYYTHIHQHLQWPLYDRSYSWVGIVLHSPLQLHASGPNVHTRVFTLQSFLLSSELEAKTFPPTPFQNPILNCGCIKQRTFTALLAHGQGRRRVRVSTG